MSDDFLREFARKLIGVWKQQKGETFLVFTEPKALHPSGGCLLMKKPPADVFQKIEYVLANPREKEITLQYSSNISDRFAPLLLKFIDNDTLSMVLNLGGIESADLFERVIDTEAVFK